MPVNPTVFTVVATPWGILALGFRLELQDYNDRISLDIVPLSPRTARLQ